MESYENSAADLNQEGGPQEAADQPQRFKTLGAHLAALRKSLGVTQQKLAERSALTRFPFDRTFVAHVESGNASPSTARFLSYLSLLHADPNSVLKLVDIAIDHGSVPLGLGYREYLEHARKCHDEFNDDEALSWLLVGLRQAEEKGEKVNAAKLKIGAAIVLRSQKSLLFARRMAEEAVNCPEIDDGDRTRAAIMAGQICANCGEHHVAQAYQLLAEALDPKTDDLLSVYVTQNRGGLAVKAGKHAEAATYLRKAVSGFERLKERSREARNRASLARVCWLIGQRSEAESEMKLALATIRRWPSRQHTLGTLIDAGWLAMERKEYKEARKLLLESELLAKDCDPETLLVVARAHLLDLALRTQDAPLKHFMKTFVVRKLPSAQLLADDRRYAEQVLAQLSKEPSPKRARRPKVE